MKKNWLLAISLALVLAIVGVAGFSPASAVLGKTNLTSQQQGIWVTGQGEVTAVPDIATLRLGIEAQEATVAEAHSKAAEAMDKVVAALIDNGVAERDIQTLYLSIHQVTRWDGWLFFREKKEETRVTNMVTAKVREIDKVGVIIDAVVEAGGDLIRIHGISFSVDDPSAYYDEARRKAMADARAKAEQLAELAGVSLGKPTFISEGIQVPIYPPGVRMEIVNKVAEPRLTPIMPGEMEIRLTIQVAYAILE